jgi:hypothetical protein
MRKRRQCYQRIYPFMPAYSLARSVGRAGRAGLPAQDAQMVPIKQPSQSTSPIALDAVLRVLGSSTMNWDGYTVFSVLSGVVLLVCALAVPGLPAKDRFYGFAGGHSSSATDSLSRTKRQVRSSSRFGYSSSLPPPSSTSLWRLYKAAERPSRQWQGRRQRPVLPARLRLSRR